MFHVADPCCGQYRRAGETPHHIVHDRFIGSCFSRRSLTSSSSQLFLQPSTPPQRPLQANGVNLLHLQCLMTGYGTVAPFRGTAFCCNDV